MKKNITTYEELLFSLSTKGDPTAFYTLANPYLKEMYVKLRSENTLSEEAAEKVKLLSCKVFKSFQKSHPVDFDKSFRSYPELSASTDHNLDDYERLESEYCEFQKELQSYLLKSCAKNRAFLKEKKLKFAFNSAIRLILFFIVLVSICGALFYYFYKTQTVITLIFKSSRLDHSLTIPFNPNAENQRNAAISDSIPLEVKSETAVQINLEKAADEQKKTEAEEVNPVKSKSIRTPKRKEFMVEDTAPELHISPPVDAQTDSGSY